MTTTTEEKAFPELSPGEELAYLAGFFDGEGCVMINRNRKAYGPERKPRQYVRAMAVNTSGTPLYKLNELFGGHVTLLKRKNDAHKDIYRWEIICRPAAVFLYTIQPYLTIKYELIDLALEFYRSLHNGNGKGNSWDYTDKELSYQEFLCDEVHRLNKRGHNDTND